MEDKSGVHTAQVFKNAEQLVTRSYQCVIENMKEQNVTVYLHVVSVDHNLDDSIPDLLCKDQRSVCIRKTHLLTDVIAGKSDQVENDVDVPDVQRL